MSEGLKIAHFSDMHCGDLRFDRELMNNCIEIINAEKPDLVVLAGDLTLEGYREQFEEAKGHLDRISCPHKMVIAGNHDCRNVGYIHFEELIGPRSSALRFSHSGACSIGLSEEVEVVAVDSNKPDVNDGEVGRHNYEFIAREFSAGATFKILVLHHHLVHIPGTGRERNIVWDAGDVLSVLRETKVDITLSGHKHVPYVWPLARMYLITSGTASTHRTRGLTPPSFNIIQVVGEEMTIDVVSSVDGSRLSSSYPRWWCHERFADYRN